MSSTIRSRRPRRSRAQWGHLIAEQAASGLSARAFCEQHGLALRTFERWERKLNRPARSPTPAFLELPLPEPGATPMPAAPGWELELELGDGTRLRLRRR